MKKFSLATVCVFCLFSLTNVHGQQWGLYTLYATKNGTQAFLIDTANTPVTYHTWTFGSTKKTAYSAYLVPGDTLVRTYSYTASGGMTGGGVTGAVQKVIWNGTVTWDFQYNSSTYTLHHDICPLPNGNVLMISYELKTVAQATQAGASSNVAIKAEKLMEVHPTGATTGTVVWEWHLWDHLCQNYNSAKDNYVTSIIDNPQLLNINYLNPSNPDQSDRWHMNGVDYNAALDQIAISIHFMNELYIIDHSTTTAQAAGHAGGNAGHGGDFLYRWGNPAAYGATGTTDFNVIHDAHWVPSDNPNYPNYLCGYNNKGGTGNVTAIDIWNPPYNGYNYTHTTGTAYAPSTYTYRYTCPFSAQDEGNSQQLPNGNMLVNNAFGSLYEVNAAGTTIWSKNGTNSTHCYRYSLCYVRGPQVVSGASDNEVCTGTAITLSSAATSVTESNPTYTYSWSSNVGGYTASTQNPSATPYATTNYTVTVSNTAIGCSNTSSVTVIVDSLPFVPVITQNGNTLNSSQAFSYQWYFNSGVISGANAQSYNPAQSGNYQVQITDANGCSAMSADFAYVTTGIDEKIDNNSLTFYPNPTTGLVNIGGDFINDNDFEVTVRNTFGAILMKVSNSASLDFSGFTNGIYFVSILSKNINKGNKKVILIK